SAPSASPRFAAASRANTGRVSRRRSSCSISPATAKASTSASRRIGARKRRSFARLHHDGELLRCPRDAGVEPALAAVGEGEGFVEQHHVVPLRALRLVHGEHIAVIELVIGLAARPIELLEATGK